MSRDLPDLLEYHGYGWFVDVDHLPRLAWWRRPFAQFRPWDHFAATDSDSFRGRVEDHLAANGIRVRGGRITALLDPRVLRRRDPVSLFWCHDRTGALVCVVAEVRTPRGRRHCFTLRPDEIDVEFREHDRFVMSVDMRDPAPAPSTGARAFCAAPVSLRPRKG